MRDRGEEYDENWETVSGILVNIWGDPDLDTVLLNKLICFAQKGRSPNDYISAFSAWTRLTSHSSAPAQQP